MRFQSSHTDRRASASVNSDLRLSPVYVMSETDPPPPVVKER